MSDDGDERLKPRAWNSFLGGDDSPKGLPVGNSEELTRVLNLPRRTPVTEDSPTATALVELMMERLSLGPRQCDCRTIDDARFEGGKHGCLDKLLWIQAWALYEAGVANGLLGHIAAGSGKTMIFLLTPLVMRDCKLALLLVPPSLLDQIQVDWQLLNQHFRVPNMTVHTGARKSVSYDARRRADGSEEPMLHVMSFNRISSMESSDYIDKLQPDVVISDEVDAFKGVDSSSRSLRLLRFFSENQECRFVGATGSLMNASPAEFSHLAYLALRDLSPLPRDKETVDDWSRHLGASKYRCPPGALKRFLNPGEPEEDVRKAFGRRLADTLGFIVVAGRQVITTSEGHEVGLIVRDRPIATIPKIVEDALALVRKNIRPDTFGGSDQDEIIVDPMEQARCAREVSTGMFYRWVFPRGEPRWLRQEWYEARKLWNSEQRAMFLRGIKFMDSPTLCENAAKRFHKDLPPAHLKGCRDDKCSGCMPEWQSEHWPRWRDIMDQVVPETEAVRLHPFLVEDAAQWALTNPGIVWYGMTEFADWLSEISDLPIYAGGTGAQLVRDERGARSVIASLKAHGRGRDRLQYSFHRQLFVHTPASARNYAQYLARLHRRNQKELEVITDVYIHTKELKGALTQAMLCGEAVEETLQEEQKLLLAWRGSVDLLDDGDGDER